MPIVSVWSDVTIAMQSALTTGVTATGITNANPGVVTHAGATGTDPSDGDFVLMTTTGMHEINGRVFRVDSSGSGTFELENEDTTEYGTFTSGTFKEVTFGTTLATVTDLSASGGDFNFIDTTTIHADIASQIPGVANASTFSFTNLWDVTDAHGRGPYRDECRIQSQGAAVVQIYLRGRPDHGV